MPAGSYLAISSLRLPGHDLPELRATTIEGEKLLADGLGSGRWREDERDPRLVRRLGPAPARPGIPGRVAPGRRTAAIEHDENYHSFFGGVARKR